VLWGLAVAGQAGAEHALGLLAGEFDLALALSGCSSVDDIDAALLAR
jgi:4-hydroxymandelate oxidase